MSTKLEDLRITTNLLDEDFMRIRRPATIEDWIEVGIAEGGEMVELAPNPLRGDPKWGGGPTQVWSRLPDVPGRYLVFPIPAEEETTS